MTMRELEKENKREEVIVMKDSYAEEGGTSRERV